MTVLNYVRHSTYVHHQRAYYFFKKPFYLLTNIEVQHGNVIVNWGLSSVEKSIMYPFYVLKSILAWWLRFKGRNVLHTLINA